MRQMALPLGIHAEQTFDSFHVSSDNAMAVASVQALVQGRGDDSQLFLWGEEGVGKSHLLTAACHAAGDNGLRVAYLPGEHLNDVDALLGVEACDILCLDDVHEISSPTVNDVQQGSDIKADANTKIRTGANTNTSAEERLFHAMNRCRESGTRVLISANVAIEDLSIELADLKTRLQWGPAFQVGVLQDEAMYNALEQLLMARDLDWNDDVVPYMLKRFPRDVGALRRFVMKLDEASMQAKRRITIPFLKTVL